MEFIRQAEIIKRENLNHGPAQYEERLCVEILELGNPVNGTVENQRELGLLSFVEVLLAALTQLINFDSPFLRGGDTSGLPRQPLHVRETVAKVEVDEVGFGDGAHTNLLQ